MVGIWAVAMIYSLTLILSVSPLFSIFYKTFLRSCISFPSETTLLCYTITTDISSCFPIFQRFTSLWAWTVAFSGWPPVMWCELNLPLSVSAETTEHMHPASCLKSSGYQTDDSLTGCLLAWLALQSLYGLHYSGHWRFPLYLMNRCRVCARLQTGECLLNWELMETQKALCGHVCDSWRFVCALVGY